MVPTDTHDRSGNVGDKFVMLTWPSVVDGRPDRPSRGRRRIVPDVCRERSSKSTHCSKMHGSYHPRTIGLGSFTRRPVWTRRASHPAPSGRPPRGGAKVTWFRYPREYLGYSREDPGRLITYAGGMRVHRRGLERPHLVGHGFLSPVPTVSRRRHRPRPRPLPQPASS